MAPSQSSVRELFFCETERMTFWEDLACIREGDKLSCIQTEIHLFPFDFSRPIFSARLQGSRDISDVSTSRQVNSMSWCLPRRQQGVGGFWPWSTWGADAVVAQGPRGSTVCVGNDVIIHRSPEEPVGSKSEGHAESTGKIKRSETWQMGSGTVDVWAAQLDSFMVLSFHWNLHFRKMSRLNATWYPGTGKRKDAVKSLGKSQYCPKFSELGNMNAIFWVLTKMSRLCKTWALEYIRSRAHPNSVAATFPYI